ncbi:MAG: RusA family crossover junction endodeoxyribonuclease [Desulfovibrio sp.]|nr:RusA family crossover junction endodeoxyribonuclease [Desulfovibrio sp.]
MNTLKFFLHVTPTAQARPRHAMINGHAMTYKSPAQKDNERTLEACLLEHQPESPFTGPLALAFVAALPVPKSKSRKALAAMLSGAEPPQKKPDLDNLAKQLKDAMTRLQFWNDDRQVTELRCKKIWAERGYWKVAVYPAAPLL